jgi:hypothetical protein
VDYSKDGNLLVLEPSNESGATPDEGFVKMTTPTYLKLTTGLPAYIKHTGDQSWVFNFRTEATYANRFVIQTVQPDQSFELSVSQRTGFAIVLSGSTITALFHKGFRDTLVSVAFNIGDFDMSVNINSVVITYERIDHRMTLYFNGVFAKSATAPASFIDKVIDWSTSDNLYVNRFYQYSPALPSYYHKISVYDKVLTLEEVVDIYDETQL